MNTREPRQISPTGFGLLLAGILLLLLAVFHREFYRSLHDPELLISEIMSVNHSTLADADGDYSDWIELYNPQARTQSLSGWFLTDDFREPKKWAFPNRELGPGEFLIVFASGKERTNQLAELHANFSLSEKGEYLALLKPDGKTVVHEYLPKFPPLEGDLSFGLRAAQFTVDRGRTASSGYRHHAFFVAPTPGRANQAEMRGRVADTQFSHDRGFYTEPLAVEITSATPGAEIWFTTDGSIPARGTGSRYETPIPIREPTVLRAAAFKSDFKTDFKSTDVDTHTYLFAEQVIHQTGAGFPPTWGVRNESPVVADYEMDPEIVDDPQYRERLLKSVTALPTLSVALSRAALFDPKTNRVWILLERLVGVDLSLIHI